jgi:hypothetical protein
MYVENPYVSFKGSVHGPYKRASAKESVSRAPNQRFLVHSIGECTGTVETLNCDICEDPD